MGQTARTTKLLLDLSARDQGGANAGKRSHLEETVKILDAARQFYLDLFLAHPDKLMERVEVLSKKTGELREGLISSDKLLTWVIFPCCLTVITASCLTFRSTATVTRSGSRLLSTILPPMWSRYRP